MGQRNSQPDSNSIEKTDHRSVGKHRSIPAFLYGLAARHMHLPCIEQVQFSLERVLGQGYIERVHLIEDVSFGALVRKNF
jgi:hypothetical protein